jgi:hypothetical protein
MVKDEVGMKRFYHNMSNETKKYRTWVLLQDTIGEDDLKWLMGFGIPIRVEAPEQRFDTASGKTYTVYGKTRYTLDTTTDRQRDMLVLKYGKDVVLIQEEIVLPGTISTCTLSGISW